MLAGYNLKILLRKTNNAISIEKYINPLQSGVAYLYPLKTSGGEA